MEFEPGTDPFRKKIEINNSEVNCSKSSNQKKEITLNAVDK